MIPVIPVMLCGAYATCLWTLSLAGLPNQFRSFTGNESLFQQAAQCLNALGADDIQIARPLLFTGEEHRSLAAEQLREVSSELGAGLLESGGRNIVPAQTLAALFARQSYIDPVLVVNLADQTAASSPPFILAIRQALREAAKGGIVRFEDIYGRAES